MSEQGNQGLFGDLLIRWRTDRGSVLLQAFVMALAGGVVLGLSFYGWWKTHLSNGDVPGLMEGISCSIDTLMGKEYVILEKEPIPPHWALGAALVGAKIVLVLGGVMLFFQKAVRSFLFRRVSGHVVVCGLGEKGAIIAESLLRTRDEKSGQRNKVALIDRDESVDGISVLKRRAAHVVAGNAVDPAVLREAGVSRAARTIVVTGSDENNLAIAREASKLGCKDVIAAVESFEVRSYFRERFHFLTPDSSSRMIGFLSRGARRLMRTIALEAVREEKLRKKGIAILIQADGPFRDELIRAAALMLQISAEIRPRIFLCGVTKEDQERFESRFPESHLVVDLTWHHGDSCTAITRQGESPDYAVISLDQDARTLELAERFRQRHNTSPQRIVACLREITLRRLADDSDRELIRFKTSCSGSEKPAPTESQVLAILVSIKGVYELAMGGQDPLDDDLDAEGRLLHEDYCRINPKSVSAVPWESLPERLKDSNRLQAAHHCVKREAWQQKGGEDEHSLLIHLGRCEHMRWMAEKVMDGWRWSGSDREESRNDGKLLHHLLIPFDELTQAEKDKDLNPIRRALGLSEG
jgi:Trk K+ transport system NAD-binding subunit